MSVSPDPARQAAMEVAERLASRKYSSQDITRAADLLVTLAAAPPSPPDERLKALEDDLQYVRDALQLHVDTEGGGWIISEPIQDALDTLNRANERYSETLAREGGMVASGKFKPEISHDPTQRAEATTTPEGAKGWVDQAGSAQVLAGGHGLDVAPDAQPGGSELRPADEQDGGGKPSTAPTPPSPPLIEALREAIRVSMIEAIYHKTEGNDTFAANGMIDALNRFDRALAAARGATREEPMT